MKRYYFGICTRALPATATKGCRIEARLYGFKTIIPFPKDKEPIEAHREAVKKMALEQGLPLIEWHAVTGYNVKDGYLFVHQDC